MRNTHSLIRNASEFTTACIVSGSRRVDVIAAFVPRSDSPPRVCHFTGNLMSCMTELVEACLGEGHAKNKTDREMWFLVAGYAHECEATFTLHVREVPREAA